MSTYPNQNGRGNDNNRDGPHRPPRVDRNRYNDNYSHGGQAGFRPHDKGRTWAKPEGKHTRFPEDDSDSGSTARKRDRSLEPPSSAQPRVHADCKDGSVERDIKRAKLQEEASSSRSEGNSRSRHTTPIDVDELNIPSSPIQDPDGQIEPALSASSTCPNTQSSKDPEPKIEQRPSFIARAIGLFTVDDPRSHKSKEVQEAQEAATRHQAELVLCRYELDQSRDEQETLKKRIAVLEEAEQQMHLRLSNLEAGQKKAQCEADVLYWQLDEANTCLRRTKQELKESQDKLASFRNLSHRLNDEANQLRQTVSKNEQRIHALAVEKGNFSSQLKSLRNERKGKGGDESSIDVFDHRLDQVSEARIKSGVESLNDSLDNLVMELLEAGEQLVVKNADLVQQSAERVHNNSALLRSLAQPNLTPENRGLLLDAQLHDRLHQELYELFFFGEVASKRIDPHGVIEAIFNELTQREPWTVVQRWRAITASSLFTLFNETEFSNPIREVADGIIALLAWAHGLAPQQFEAMFDMIHSRLQALYKEANDLSILVRRDILSVRMSISSVITPSFDPATANSIWPEMGAVAGDEVVGRIKFGLTKLKEDGEIFCLLKPEVATTALIRETSKNG